jgi:predicted signal transduction protein with EAL and GGDEF domain
MSWSRLFPKGEAYTGPKVPFYFLILIAVISTVRSLIHIFAADGGAHSIAGISVNVAGGTNIIAMFAQWGASQLILALVYWFVILRYRSLTPLMLAVIVLEQLLRMGAGNLKPLEIAAPPPGALGSQIVLPLAAVALVWSLWQNNRKS